MVEERLAGLNDSASVILATIVLYRMQFGESAACKSIQQAVSNIAPKQNRTRVFIFDNTPGTSDPGPLPEGMQYEASGQNAGLAEAYNRALDKAQQLRCPWLLLLDQDTVLPENFLESLLGKLKEHEANTEIVAVVPIVRSGGVVVSPKRVGFLGLNTFAENPQGIQDAEIASINSGTAIRCDFVRSIGGFNRAYWLDYLDHWLFRQIYATGKKAVVSNCFLEHSLSVQDYRRNISLTRYRSILAGESAFMTTHKSKLQIPFYLLRLVARSIKLAIQGQPDLALLTVKMIAKIARHPTRSLEEAAMSPDPVSDQIEDAAS
ncbi:MAG: glycosyltransferase [Terracidiphilus sp.]